MKIHIIGAPGSGKTFLALLLSQKLNISHYDLDEIFWDNTVEGYGVKADATIRDAKFKEIIEKDSWIIEGIYYGWVMESFSNSDLIIVMKTGVRIRGYRILKRFLLRKFKIVPTKKKETIKGAIDVIRYTHEFDNRNLKEIEKVLEPYKDKVFEVKSKMDLAGLLERIGD